MMPPRPRTLRALAAALLLGAPLVPAAFAASGAGVETKITLEESLERRLKSVISQILDTQDVIVIVTAEMYTEEEKKNPVLPEETNVLPGVPVKERIGEMKALDAFSLKETRTLVKKLSATLVLDQGVADADINVIKNVTTGLLGLKTERGDSLEIQRMDFHRGEPKGFNWKRFTKPPDLWWVVGLGLGAFFILFMTVFFFGSFRVFIREFVKALRSYAESMEEQIKMMQMQKEREKDLSGRSPEGEAAPEVDRLLSKAGSNGGGFAGSPAAPVENGQGAPPFSFLNESHLRNLKFLLRAEKPDQVAIVANYLPPAVANDLLASLDPARRAETLGHLARVSEMDPDLVKAVEAKIKERIAYVVGGEDRLQNLLDNADPGAQESLLAAVTQRDAPLAARLRSKLFTLDDLAQLDGPVLAAIVRRVNARTLAGVLRDVKPEVREKVLASLPTGSADILREEISLARPLPPQRLAAEQRRLLDAIRRLEAEGVVQLRREGTES
jgi:hypothetical protein